MRVLIIGGTGLISTPISRILLERGVDLTLFNRGNKEADIPAGARLIKGDRRDFAAFAAQMAQEGTWDCVIDMVCYHPSEAESAVQVFSGRTRQYIFCSTVDVYNRPADRYPYTEAEPQLRTHSGYATNKVRCEAVFMQAHRAGKLPVTIIRPAYTYGEGAGINHSMGRGTYYLDRVRKGKPIIVHGDGSSLWVCCYAGDVAAAFVGAVGNEITLGKSYHVTGEEWLTWNRYHELVAEAIGAPPPTLVHIPTDLLKLVAPDAGQKVASNYQYNNIFDNTAAHTDLGFRYTVPWVEGVRRTVTWLDAHGQIEDSDVVGCDDQIIAAWQRLCAAMAQELAPCTGA